MKNELTITLVQTDNHWEKIDDNLDMLSNKLFGIDEEIDILLLPELFTTGFTMTGINLGESMDGKTIAWMKEWAKKKDCLVAGSVLIEEEGKLFNRFVAALPKGEIKYSDKRHLFSFAGEDEVFEQGEDRLIFEFRGFRICPLICYDLRFPVWSRNTDNYDLLLYVANWPDARMSAWDVLLRARAIENLCYVAAVNRVGTDKNNLNYVGHSTVVDPMGENILNFKEGAEGIDSITINRTHIEKVRRTFRFLDDKDSFIIQ
jgi:predicted amidohydrolase